MFKKIVRFALISSFIFFVSGCGLSEEEALANIKETIETAFNSESPEPNQQFANFNIFFSDQMTVVEESENNLIYSDDQDQAYILFYNPLEDHSSEAFYLAEKERDQHLLLESYQDEDEDRFGYVKVEKIDQEFELQVGVGGVRITTQTTLNQLEDDFINMVNTINSLEARESAR